MTPLTQSAGTALPTSAIAAVVLVVSLLFVGVWWVYLYR